MNVSDVTSCAPPGSAPLLFFMVFYSLLFVVGLLLNSFSLRAHLCRAPPRSGVAVYLKNLAAADFLLSLSLPVRVLKFVPGLGPSPGPAPGPGPAPSPGPTPLHLAHCHFGAVAFYLNMYASILFLGFIAANRYLQIVRPTGVHVLRSACCARAVCALTWLFLLTTSVAYVVLALVTESTPPPPSASVALSCERLHGPRLRLYYQAVHTCCAAMFLLVLFSLVFFYHSTSRRLAEALRRRRASAGAANLARSRRNMSVLVGVFCVCFVPYHLVRLPAAFLPALGCRSQIFLYFLKELTIAVSALNVCLDPLLYFIFCKAFRARMGAGRRGSSTHATATHAATHTAATQAGRFNMNNRCQSRDLSCVQHPE